MRIIFIYKNNHYNTHYLHIYINIGITMQTHKLKIAISLLFELFVSNTYVKRIWIIYKRNKLLAAASIGDAYSAADLKRGEEGVVLTVIGDEALRQRLAAMGVMSGTVIATPDASIFGDPRTYLVRGYQLSMRNTEAAMILLQTETQTIQQLEKATVKKSEKS